MRTASPYWRRAVPTNCVVLPAGASVMAPPEVQSTDPAAAPQHPHDHAGSRMSRSRARLRACATAYDSIVVQQISLLNVVEGFLERQRSCSIHLSRRMRPRRQRSDSMLETLTLSDLWHSRSSALRTIPIRSTVCSSSTAVPPTEQQPERKGGCST